MNDGGGKYYPAFEHYHAVPERWGHEAVIAEHQRLGGTFDIA